MADRMPAQLDLVRREIDLLESAADRLMEKYRRIGDATYMLAAMDARLEAEAIRRLAGLTWEV